MSIRAAKVRNAAAVVATITVLAGCSSSTARHTNATIVSGPYSADPAICSGHVPPATDVGPLTAGTHLTAAVACLNQGGLTSARATKAQLITLQAALAEPSVPMKQTCDASGSIAIAYALRLSNGSWVHPPVPSDGCHPSEKVMSTLIAIATGQR